MKTISKTRAAFLIYRPAVDYEDSIDPYIIVSTEKKTKKIVEDLRELGREVSNSFPEPIYQYYDSENDRDEYWKKYEAREEQVKKIIEGVTLPDYFSDAIKRTILRDIEYQSRVEIDYMELKMVQ